MKPKKKFHQTNLFACLLAFAAMIVFTGFVWVKFKPSNTESSVSFRQKESDDSPRGSSSPALTADPYAPDHIKPGEIYPLKRLVEDCDTLPRGETSMLCYDRVRKCGFLVTGQRVIRQVTASPSSRDVTVEQLDADGNRTTRRVSPTYSQVDFANVLITYYDADGKKSDVPVSFDRPEIFSTEKNPKINWDDMRKY